MKIEDHLKSYKEHRDTLNWAIDRGLANSQRIIGTHVSRAIVEFLSAYLHKIKVIETGFQINHRWFKSEKVFNKFSDFPEKQIIIKKLIELELKSENLTYGSQKSEEEIKSVLTLFNEMERIILNLMETKDGTRKTS